MMLLLAAVYSSPVRAETCDAAEVLERLEREVIGDLKAETHSERSLAK